MNAVKGFLGRLDTDLHTEQEQDVGSQDVIDTLLAENQKLSRQLRAVVTKARQNEEKLNRFLSLELRLIASTQVREFLHLILHEYRAEAHLDEVTLCLLDCEYECERIVDTDENFADIKQHIVFFQQIDELLNSLLQNGIKPYLGPYISEKHHVLFKQTPPKGGSLAIVPLIVNGKLIGSLNLASRRHERFVNGAASDFLERFAAIVAVCFKNVLSHEQLKRVGLTDVLTGINNRRFFDQRLIEEIITAQRSKQPMCVLFFDMDKFKKINDTHGHHVGDIVLREVANLIRQRIRANDVLSRYGGEEFSAILTQTSLEVAFDIAERIRKDIAAKKFVMGNGKTLTGTISIGLACMHPVPEHENAEIIGKKLLQLADENLYEAKRTGRNRVVAHRNAAAAATPA